jgi:hypothetical protein
MNKRTVAVIVCLLAASTAYAESKTDPDGGSSSKKVADTATSSDIAQRWGIDFSGTAACRDKDAGAGITGFATSFEYLAPRDGTLMSTLGLAAQVVRLSCLSSDKYAKFYCGSLVYLFGSGYKGDVQAKKYKEAIQKERIKARDIAKRFGDASRDERRELVGAVVAQFEKCGRREDVRRLAAALDSGLDKYEKSGEELALSKCRATCDPRTKSDWGVATVHGPGGATKTPSTSRCFAGCSSDFHGASLLTQFIHRRVLQGISVDEMRDLSGVLAGRPPAPKKPSAPVQNRASGDAGK